MLNKSEFSFKTHECAWTSYSPKSLKRTSGLPRREWKINSGKVVLCLFGCVADVGSDLEELRLCLLFEEEPSDDPVVCPVGGIFAIDPAVPW